MCDETCSPNENDEDDTYTTQDNTIKIKEKREKKKRSTTKHKTHIRRKKIVAHIAVKWSHTFFSAHMYQIEMKREIEKKGCHSLAAAETTVCDTQDNNNK